MNLTTWNPLREMEEMLERYNRRTGLLPRTTNNERESLMASDWSPAVDIEESSKEFLIKVELPEVKKDDVKVTINEGVLSIEGERKIEKESKEDKKYHRVERFYGRFARSFSLPDNVKHDDIKAEFKDGMLKVHLEKTEKVKPKSIDVEIAA
ncbi:MAG: heat-shock protein [Oleiphilus sp.]|nr:MAG: heat-shock protein [Oleiphilus sp.]